MQLSVVQELQGYSQATHIESRVQAPREEAKKAIRQVAIAGHNNQVSDA